MRTGAPSAATMDPRHKHRSSWYHNPFARMHLNVEQAELGGPNRAAQDKMGGPEAGNNR
jgi:hypothetical protein